MIDNYSNSICYNNQETLEFSSFCYRRQNHFADWLANSTGRESINVPDQILDNIMEELAKRKITDEKPYHANSHSVLLEGDEAENIMNTQCYYAV